MIDADANMAMEAAALKHRYKLGYADSFAASLALPSKPTLVSADPSFEKSGQVSQLDEAVEIQSEESLSTPAVSTFTADLSTPWVFCWWMSNYSITSSIVVPAD